MPEAAANSMPARWFSLETIGLLTSTDAGSGSYSDAKEDYIDRFYRLVSQWRAQTLHSSFTEQKVQHSAFRQIVDMGESAVPLILKEIATHTDFLYLALQLITGENPVPERDRTSARAAIDAWILWADRAGDRVA